MSYLFSNISRLLILMITGPILLGSCDKPQPSVISLASPESTTSSLIWLTQQLGYFEQQGIHLEMTDYPSGKHALAAMIQGKTDLVITAETPFVIASFQHDDLSLFATMVQSNNDS